MPNVGGHQCCVVLLHGVPGWCGRPTQSRGAATILISHVSPDTGVMATTAGGSHKALDGLSLVFARPTRSSVNNLLQSRCVDEWTHAHQHRCNAYGQSPVSQSILRLTSCYEMMAPKSAIAHERNPRPSRASLITLTTKHILYAEASLHGTFQSQQFNYNIYSDVPSLLLSSPNNNSLTLKQPCRISQPKTFCGSWLKYVVDSTFSRSILLSAATLIYLYQGSYLPL